MLGWRRLTASRAPEPSLALRLWTLAAVLVSVFAVTEHDDFAELRLIVPALISAGFAFSYWRRGKPSWWVKILLALGCLEVARQFLRGIFADPFHTSVPLTVFLLWLQTLHAFDVPARRDLLFSLLSSVILMTVAAAFSIQMTYLLYLAAYAAAAVQVLVHNAWHGAREAAQLAADEPVPRAGGLTMAANHLLVMVLLAAGMVFLVTPRFEGMRLTTLPFTPRLSWLDVFSGRLVNPAYPGDGAQAEGGSPGSWNPRGYFGFSATVDLRLRGRLDDAVVMRVRATRQFNWRALVFDTYTGSGWKTSDPRVYAIDGTYPPITLVHRGDEVLGSAVRPQQVVQTFYIEREQPNVVFAAPLPERLYVPSGRVYLDRFGAVRLTNTLKPGTVYSVVSRALIPDPQRLRASPEEVPQAIRSRYLGLPAALPARVRALAQRLVAQQPTRYDRVVAVQRFLATNYRYDLEIPPQARPGDAVDYFLFEEHRGYCEHFASAMVVLLRAAGIPARLVTGYTPGTPNLVTGLLEVRNSDAHAWVEVFFIGQGWVEFDPTPGFLDAASLGHAVRRQWAWQDLWDRLSPRLQRWVAASPASGPVLAAAARLAGMSGAVLLVAALGTAGTRRVMALKHAPNRARGPQRILAGIYDEMCAVLARRSLRRAPAETVEEYRRRVERAAGAAQPLPEVGLISGLVDAAAYGGAEPDHQALQQARAHMRALAARVSRRRVALH